MIKLEKMQDLTIWDIRILAELKWNKVMRNTRKRFVISSSCWYFPPNVHNFPWKHCTWDSRMNLEWIPNMKSPQSEQASLALVMEAGGGICHQWPSLSTGVSPTLVNWPLKRGYKNVTGQFLPIASCTKKGRLSFDRFHKRGTVSVVSLGEGRGTVSMVSVGEGRGTVSVVSVSESRGKLLEIPSWRGAHSKLLILSPN